MRRSVEGARARVKRLASQVVWDGCPVCWENEARVRLCWHDVLADPPVSVTDVLAKEPQSQTCAACGRTYALIHTVIGWEQPDSTQPSRRHEVETSQRQQQGG